MRKTLTGDTSFIAPGFECPPENPIELLKAWFEAADEYGVNESRGCVLSSTDQYHQPNSRVVLLTEINSAGVIFGTSGNSAKGQEFEHNPNVAGNVWWRETIQQIRFQGEVSQLSDEISDRMFHERTREAQAATAVCQPSQVLFENMDLKRKAKALVDSKQIISRPKDWHGYQIVITAIEFWHGRPDRLHQRLKYQMKDKQWSWVRLQP